MCCNPEHGEKLSQCFRDKWSTSKKKSEIKSEILIYFCPLIVEDQERKISNAKKINKKKKNTFL